MPTPTPGNHVLYIAPLLLGSVALIAVAFLAWRRRGAPGATPLLVLTLLGAAWPFGYAWELVGADFPTKVLWAKAEYLGIATGPTAWLWLTIEYTGRGRWLTRRRQALLAVEPVVILLLVWSNEYHGLVWRSIAQQDFGSLTVLNFSHGAVFWIHATYGYLLVFFGTTLLAEGFLHALRLHWRRSVALVVAAAMPWGAILAFGFGFKLQGHIDPVPFVLPLSALVLVWAVTRMGLLDFGPAKRALVLESPARWTPVAILAHQVALESLTDRELGVLRLVAGGLSNNEISDVLGVSVHTTKTHVGAILRKLEVPNRTSAIRMGRELELIE